MAENFLQRLARNPYAPIDGASVTRVDELGNGYDDWNNLIAPKFEQPQQTWGETALGVATAPARMATALAGSLSPYGQDGWQVPPIIDEGVNALSAVGDAYNYGMDQDEINSRALGMAGFMMGGGGLAARPAGGTGMFAGRLAKTADQEALAIAERLAAEGADRRAIWDQTGWFQGPDSKWRFEIDDSGSVSTSQRALEHSRHRAEFEHGRPDIARNMENRGWGGKSDFGLQHDELYSAYPDLRGLFTGFLPRNSPGLRGGVGVYHNDEILVSKDIPETGYMGKHGVQLHEMQHALQSKEGFARGTTPSMFSKAEIQAERDRLLLKSWSGLPEDEAIYGPMANNVSPYDLYKRTAGETEARNVQTRMNMSADERRATPPWETQDIPDADQIVRLYSNASKEGGLLSNILGYFQGNKEPVTVRGYHGTRSEFDKFNGPSVYASENPAAASEWAMVANRDGEAPNVLPLDITASNPYYAKSLFPDQAELDRIAAADPDVVFYPPSTQHGTTFDKYPGQVFEARKPGTVRSATTGETLYSNASKEGAIPALLDMGQEARLARARDMGFDTDTTWYHGTTHDFTEFDPTRGNNEGHLGSGAYFTSSPKDAWKNYGPDGPDLTQRVELIAERLADDLGGDMDAARAQARQQIAGKSDGAIYPVMLRGKTLDLRSSTRGNPTALEMQYGPSPDEFMDVARKELGADADKWDLYDRARELADEASADATPTGELWNFIESIRRQSGDYGFDADEVLARLDDVIGDGVGAADDIDRRLRNSPLMYAEHPETGSLIGNDVIRQAFNDAGYPNIVMDAKAAFPKMPNIDPGTLHMIVSDPRNIRSVNAAFDPSKSDSANLLAANADSRPALLGAGQEQDIPDWLLPYLR
jgi:hypothetical protein